MHISVTLDTLSVLCLRVVSVLSPLSLFSRGGSQIALRYSNEARACYKVSSKRIEFFQLLIMLKSLLVKRTAVPKPMDILALSGST